MFVRAWEVVCWFICMNVCMHAYVCVRSIMCVVCGCVCVNGVCVCRIACVGCANMCVSSVRWCVGRVSACVCVLRACVFECVCACVLCV